MFVTLDHARAFDALARTGTLQAAASALHKSHTSILHAMRSLEEQTGLTLLDRSGYRLRITDQGERVLEHARRLLDAERDLTLACEELRTGWEPSLRIVFDGVVEGAPILRAAFELVRSGASTRIAVEGAYLGGVEEAFDRGEADLMITVLPPRASGLVGRALAPLRAHLVAKRTHPLARGRRRLTHEDLAAHVLLHVGDDDPRLALSTSGLEPRGVVTLADFEAKKRALLAGIGFGWLPDHLAHRELARGALVVLPFESGSEHVFSPRLYHRSGVRLGRAATRVIEALVAPPAAEAPARSTRSKGKPSVRADP